MRQDTIRTERDDCGNRILKTYQRLSSLIDVVGEVAARIPREHGLIERPSFSQMLGLGHRPSSPVGAGGSKSLSSTDVRSGWFATWPPHAFIQDGGSAPSDTTHSNCSMIKNNSVGSVAARQC